MKKAETTGAINISAITKVDQNQGGLGSSVGKKSFCAVDWNLLSILGRAICRGREGSVDGPANSGTFSSANCPDSD